MEDVARERSIATANKAVVVEYLHRLASEGQSSAAELAEAGATWWIQGNWPLGGTYGRQQLIDALAAVTGNFRSLRFEIRSITADDERVSVEMSAHADVSCGESYQNTYHLLFFLNDESRITRVKEFTDTKYDAAFFYPDAR